MTKKVVAPSMTMGDLKTQRDQLAKKLEQINAQVTDLTVISRTMANEISKIDSEISRRMRPAPEPRLSDHAILRYIERAYGIDIEAIKAKIMTPTVIQAIKNGASAVTAEGVKFKVVDNTIVTAIIPEVHKAKTKKIKEVDTLQEGLDEYYNE